MNAGGSKVSLRIITRGVDALRILTYLSRRTPEPSHTLRCHAVEEPLLVFGDLPALARVLLLPFPVVSVRTLGTFDDPAKSLYNVHAWTCQQYESGVLALEARGRSRGRAACGMGVTGRHQIPDLAGPDA